jgi:predicted transglutaminase-like cysteine proteinase
MKTLLVVLCCLVPLPVLADPYYPQPPAHAELLARRPSLEFDGWAPWRVDMQLLSRVNREINASMSYRPEAADVWGVGADCEDYAMRKLDALIDSGVPRGALRLAVARVAGQGHAVLVVRDLWVLDNLRDQPVRLDGTDLRIEAWETTSGRWNPAGAFADLAEHLRWAQDGGERPAGTW